ncbi:MAG: chloride channel protein [Gammaproteobacteria bacterium]|nr:chloride channel protein [Gammaproteobacteria bacterium]
MNTPRSPNKLVDHLLHNLRISLSRPDAMVQLAVLGLSTGVVSGVVVVAFRLVIEGLQISLLPGMMVENFESLPIWWRIGFPILGASLIALIFKFFAAGENLVGVVHVLERLAYHQGKLNLRGLLLQFTVASIAIISGHSVGKEGPGIHLGAASSSLIGQGLGLPNNTLRTLVACGCAAAIAASFNTPLAGVILTLEVIMMEYTAASFTPVILAAVSATAVSRAFYGAEPASSAHSLELVSLMELPYMFVVGIIIGTASALLIWLTKWFAQRGKNSSLWLRLAMAGLLTGVCGAVYPQIMGIGYDTVSQALLGELSITLLLGVIFFKVIVTAGAIGLGVPAGVIGPTLFIGACIGAMMGIAAQIFSDGASSNSGLYVLLGMGAMMGATLQAPLAALTAVAELTYNPNIILPGMLTIVAAGLTSRQLFSQRSIFTTLIRCRGLDYSHDPILQAMRRVGVASVMNRRVQRQNDLIKRSTAEELMSKHPDWIVIDQDGQATTLLRALDLARYMKESKDINIDLLKIPAKRLQVTPIPLQASVDEALKRLNETQADAIVVERITAPGVRRIYGVLTKEALEGSYRL